MRKTTRFISLLLTLVFMTGVMAGCSDGRSSYNENASGSVNDGVLADNYNDTAKSDDSKNGSDNQESVKENRKIIEKISIQLETKKFDELLNNIQKKTDELNGYIEKSSITGTGYDQTDDYKTGSITVRIPTSKKNDFTKYIENSGSITQKDVETDDVTLKYVDMQSRLNALKKEKEALEKLLGKASDINEIMNIQKQLTSIIADIESYTSQLKTYDNLIDYTTFNIEITEVEISSNSNQSVWSEIAEKFMANVNSLGVFARGLFVGIVSGSPYLAILAVIILVIVLLIKHDKKKRNAKMINRANYQTNYPTNMQNQPQNTGSNPQGTVPPRQNNK